MPKQRKSVRRERLSKKAKQSNERLFHNACVRGDYTTAKQLLEHGNLNNDWHKELETVCKQGNFDIFMLLVLKNKGKWFSHYALSTACENGHLEIVQYMMTHINVKLLAGNYYRCCKSGNLELVKYIHSNKAQWGFAYANDGSHYYTHSGYWGNPYFFDLDYGLYCAATSGNMELVKFIINIGATNYDRGLQGACEKGHTKIAMFMIEKGANRWNDALKSACGGGHLELVRFMIHKGATDLHPGLQALRGGGKYRRQTGEIIRELIAAGLNRGSWHILHMRVQCEDDSMLMLVFDRFVDDREDMTRRGTVYRGRFKLLFEQIQCALGESTNQVLPDVIVELICEQYLHYSLALL